MRVEVTVSVELTGAEGPKSQALKLLDVQKITGLTRGELETAVALGTLPKPKRIGRGKFWTVAAVHDFLTTRRAEQSK